MMVKIKACACGHAPEKLIISEGSTFRWRYIEADCGCGWMIEARVTTLPPIPDEYEECMQAWNDMPRSDIEARLAAEKRRADELAAHCERLRNFIQYQGHDVTLSGGIEGQQFIQDDIDLMLNETPRASLAHHDAQVMREAEYIVMRIYNVGKNTWAAWQAVKARADEMDGKPKELHP